MKGFAEDVACELKDDKVSLGEEEEGCSGPRAARAKPASCPGLAAGRRGDRAGERDLMPCGVRLALKEPAEAPRGRAAFQKDATPVTGWAWAAQQAQGLGAAGRLLHPPGPDQPTVTLRLGQGPHAPDPHVELGGPAG